MAPPLTLIFSNLSRAMPRQRSWGRAIAASLGGVLVLTIAACTRPNTPADSSQTKPLQVVATSTILGDLARQVANDRFEVISILEPGSDPHVYEPVPQDSRVLEEADLILYNGYHLEPGLIRLMEGVGRDTRKVAIGEVVPPLEYEKAGQRQPDPHVWGDVENGIAMVDAIVQELSTLAPDETAELEAQGEQLTTQLQTLDQWINTQIATIPPEQRKLVTTHDAFQYYAQAYGLEVLGTLIGISTEEQPSAQTLRQLVDTVKGAQVPMIFAETTLNPQLIRTVAQEAGVGLAPQSLYSDSVGSPGSGAETYATMMRSNTISIVEGLGGRITENLDL